MSTFVHVKLWDGKQVDLTYQTSEVNIGAIKQIVSQQVGSQVLSSSWYYGPRAISDYETLTSLGVRAGSHCDLFVQNAPMSASTTYQVPKQPIPSYPGMPQIQSQQPQYQQQYQQPQYQQPQYQQPQYQQPQYQQPQSQQSTFSVGPPTFYQAPPATIVQPVYAAPPTYVQPVVVLPGGGRPGGRPGRGQRVKKVWPHQPRPNEYQTIESKLNPGLVVDLEGGSPNPGARIIVHRMHGGPNQRWVLDSEGFIRSQLNGMVLDVAGGRNNAGAAVIAYPQKFHDNLNQKWFFKRGFIISKLNGLVLTVSGNRGQGSALIVDNKIKRGVGKKGHQRWYFK